MSALGLFGKLPAKGDFVSRGLSPEFQAGFEGWLAATVEGAREVLGDDWAAIYDTAPVWRFWIGPQAGVPACAGVLAASCDRVGRRYPLVVLAEAGQQPPPPLADAQPEWYAAIEAALASARAPDFVDDPGAVLTEIAPPARLYTEVALGEGHQAFWAQGPARAAAPEAAAPQNAAEPAPQASAPQASDWQMEFDAEGDDGSPFDAAGGMAFRPDPAPLQQADFTEAEPTEAPNAPIAAPDQPAFALDPEELPQLLAQACQTELQLHAASRSYWWTVGDAETPAAFLAFSGLPNAAAFAAMLGGLRAAALANEPQ